MFANKDAGIGCRVFAIVLLGLLPQVAFAEDAGSGGHRGDASSNVSAAPNGAQAPSSENAVSESAVKNTDDIDLRITVQPRHTGSKPAKAGAANVKFSLAGVKNPHRRVFSASRAYQQTQRNAVSVPISQHELLLDRRAGEHSLTLPTTHLPAATIGNTTLGIVKSGAGIGHQIIVPPSASPTVLSRGISGTNAGRRSVNSVNIGGPARTAVGLNGTLMRPTH